MFKFQPLAMQCYALRKSLMGSIKTIAQNGTIDSCQLAADLMFAPRDQPYAQKRVVRCAGEDSILQDRCLPFGMIGTDNASESVLRASQQRLLEPSFDGRWASRNDCAIFLVDSLLAKLLAEPRGALARASKGDSTCDGCIEPADDPEIHVAWFMILVLQIQTGRFEQTSIVGRCTLDDPIGWLIEHE